MATQSARETSPEPRSLYGIYTGGFLPSSSSSRSSSSSSFEPGIGYLFVFFTLAVYAVIGVLRARGSRILRRRPARARLLQRHGHRRRLDVGGLLRRHGRHAVPLGYDGLAFVLGWTGGYVWSRFWSALPAQVRRLHCSRLHGVPLRRQLRALHRRHRARGLLLHLRDGAGLRHRPDRLALPWHRLPGRRLCRSRRHPVVLDARRHARGDLDADRPVHRADRRLPHAGHLCPTKKYGIPIPELTYGQALATSRRASRRC